MDVMTEFILATKILEVIACMVVSAFIVGIPVAILFYVLLKEDK